MAGGHALLVGVARWRGAQQLAEQAAVEAADGDDLRVLCEAVRQQRQRAEQPGPPHRQLTVQELRVAQSLLGAGILAHVVQAADRDGRRWAHHELVEAATLP